MHFTSLDSRSETQLGFETYENLSTNQLSNGSMWSHLAFCSGSLKDLGMRVKYLPIFSHRSDWGNQPLWACMAWYLASCLAMSLQGRKQEDCNYNSKQQHTNGL